MTRCQTHVPVARVSRQVASKQRVKKANRYRSGQAGREKCQARQRQRACALTTRIKSLLMINTGRVSFIRSGTVT
ncbi:hypothetical protein C4J83_5434 [Pseudomonas sp. LBUM920]|nr:hypothetical protein C4J83_5434 [Pseudomonas sp. LBUM920]